MDTVERNIMKAEYFNARNNARKNYKLDVLGNREIKTLVTILKLYNADYKLDGKVFVDVGCGDSYLKGPVEQNLMKYAGFDIGECDLMSDQMPLITESVDILACYSVIEHLNDPSNLLTEAARVLKSGGFLFIETPNWKYCSTSFYDDYTHVKPYTTESLKSVLSDFGFDVLKLMPNVRCKSRLYHDSKHRFWIAKNLPFRGFGGMFSMLKGRSTGIFSLARKP